MRWTLDTFGQCSHGRLDASTSSPLNTLGRWEVRLTTLDTRLLVACWVIGSLVRPMAKFKPQLRPDANNNNHARCFFPLKRDGASRSVPSRGPFLGRARCCPPRRLLGMSRSSVRRTRSSGRDRAAAAWAD